ncbi:MAG: hypothetical protein E4H03_10755 [Myxococcales bacterium]|jgi:hypothetical protein|nr:MAG: hypothetical protein E4H03_10755 [Myxococcales bacterium]
MYDLSRFSLTDMTRCGSSLRKLGLGATSMEEAADRVVRHLHDNFIAGDTGRRSCVLVRFFKTHRYDSLDPELQAFADRVLDSPPASADMRCLTLLASSGERAEWNGRTHSVGHKVIPLPSPQAVHRIPMIARLIKQLGLEITTLVDPSTSLMVDDEQRSYNVFYVADAAGSPHIPAQKDFVVPLGIRSVLGFGGILPLGDLFTVILFSTVAIPRETLDLFRPLALCTKAAVLPFVGGPVFAHRIARPNTPSHG